MKTNNALRILSFLLVIVLVAPALATSSVSMIDASYSVSSYEIGETPSSVVITYYSDILSRGFAWYTEEDTDETALYVAEGILGEGDDFESATSKITGYNSVLWDPDVPGTRVRCHQAYVENLKPDTVYSYKLGGNGKYVYGTFVTDSKDTESVTILNFNDAQTKEPDKLNCWENTVSAAINNIGYGNVDFIAFGGDLYDDNMKAEDFSRYYRRGISIDTISKYVGSIPFIHTSGNHDDGVEMLYTSSNCVNFAGVDEENSTGYYSFDYGSVHYVVLAYFSKLSSDDFKAQLEWLEEDLKAASENENIKWTVVSTHWGFHTTGDHGFEQSSLQLAIKLAPIFSKYHVDLVLQGHDHTFSKTLPYEWDGNGYARRNKTEGIVIENPATITAGGVEYYKENGTYYVSCGAAGHRVGENEKYAAPGGQYTRAPAAIAVDTVKVNSPYADIGVVATGDFGRQMYGVLNINGDVLSYDFYVVEDDGSSVLIDTMRLFKGEDGDATAADTFSSTVMSHADSEADLVKDAKAFEALSATAQALVSAEAKAILKTVAVGKAYTYDVADSAQTVALTAVGQSEIENGKCNLYLAGEMAADSTSCGFDISVCVNGKTYDLSTECTEAYNKNVKSDSASGIASALAVNQGKLGFALTVKDIPCNDITMTVNAYCTNSAGEKIVADTVILTCENGMLSVQP